MILRILLIVALAFAVPACGVKSELTRPDGTPTPKDTADPSRPT